MSRVTLVTGPLRSGTSCVTGLLESCGFDLGKTVRVLRQPSPHNPRGHFEPDLLYTVNERLLIEAKAGSCNNSIIDPAEKSALAALASQRENYFRLFLRKFDGELCKDPLMCLTLPYWSPRWQELGRIIFCLRHPLAVARSIEKRYAVPLSMGLDAWRTYTERFFDFADSADRHVYVFDFDEFQSDPVKVFSALAGWSGRDISQKEIVSVIEEFYSPVNVHWNFAENELSTLPQGIAALYRDIRVRTGNRVTAE